MLNKPVFFAVCVTIALTNLSATQAQTEYGTFVNDSGTTEFVPISNTMIRVSATAVTVSNGPDVPSAPAPAPAIPLSPTILPVPAPTPIVPPAPAPLVAYEPVVTHAPATTYEPVTTHAPAANYQPIANYQPVTNYTPAAPTFSRQPVCTSGG